MGSTNFCGHPSVYPSIYPFVHPSLSHNPVILPPFVDMLSSFPSTFTSPLPPSLPSFFLSLPPSPPSFVLFFHSSFFSPFLPFFFYLSFVPFTLCSFHPSSILPRIQHITVSGTVVGSVFSWSAWSTGICDQTRTIQLNRCVMGVQGTLRDRGGLG